MCVYMCVGGSGVHSMCMGMCICGKWEGVCVCVCDIAPTEARTFVDCQILSTLGGRYYHYLPFLSFFV